VVRSESKGIICQPEEGVKSDVWRFRIRLRLDPCSSCCLSVIKFTLPHIPRVLLVKWIDLWWCPPKLPSFHPPILQSSCLADEAWYNKSPCPGSRVLNHGSWHNDTDTHEPVAQIWKLICEKFRLLKSSISHSAFYALYLYLLFNFAPLLCTLAYFYARLLPRSFLVLTAKFNFYCCLTLLNDFYCLSSTEQRRGKKAKPL